MFSIKLFRVLLFSTSTIFLLTSCAETKAPSVPEIIGNPGPKAHVDVRWTYEFGADGGDGVLSYKMLKGPSWLSIENNNGAKPSFKLTGVPTVRDLDELNLLEDNETTVTVELEVTDGALSSVKTFDIQVLPNKLKYFADTIEVDEGGERVDAGFLFEEGCELPKLTPYKKDGRDVYPYLVIFELDFKPETRTEVSFSLFSDYNENIAERDSSNIGKLRAGHDYVDRNGTVVFEPGINRCGAVVDIYDDQLIEGGEKLLIVSEEVISGWVVLPDRFPLNVIDDEPSVEMEGETIILNEGQSKNFTVNLSEKVDYPVSVQIIKAAGSTVTTPDYEITPELLTIPANQNSAIFSVDIKVDDDTDSNPKYDETLIITTDVSEIFNLDPINITINDWATDKEVASSAAGQEAVDHVVDADGNVIVLSTVQAATSDVEISMFDRRAGDKSFTALAAASKLVSTDNKDEVASSLAYNFLGNSVHRIGVVATSDGKVSVDSNGGRDIVVRGYKRPKANEFYEVEWTTQFGSGFDDVPLAVFSDSNSNYFVVGYTLGSLEAGVSNQGGKDAFVAKIDLSGNLKWVRQFGSTFDDIATQVTVLTNNIYVAGTTEGPLFIANKGGVDGFMTSFDSDGGVYRSTQFGSIFDEQVTGVVSDDRRVLVSGHSKGSFSLPLDPNQSRDSIDVFMINYNAIGSLGATIQYGDQALDDSSVGSVGSGGMVFIGSDTSGEYKTGDNVLLLKDAVITGVNSNNSTSSVGWHSQFGTDGEDGVINLRVYNENKLLVLWKAFDGGNTRYLISPFDFDGRMLTK